jgi:hypothetical protein
MLAHVAYGSNASFRVARHFRCSSNFGHRCAVCVTAGAVNAAAIAAKLMPGNSVRAPAMSHGAQNAKLYQAGDFGSRQTRNDLTRIKATGVR